MKIDTKKCAPITKGSTPESLLHPNKYIPAIKLEEIPTPAKKEDKEESSQPKSTKDEPRDGATPEKKKKNEASPCESGRVVRYLTNLIHTPVLTSQRHEESANRTNGRRLLEKDDIDELNQKLEDLFLGTTKKNKIDDNEPKPKDKAVPDQTASNDAATTKVKAHDNDEEDETRDPPEGAREQDENERPPSSPLGRYSKRVLSYKTCRRSEVRRSARIAAHY